MGLHQAGAVDRRVSPAVLLQTELQGERMSRRSTGDFQDGDNTRGDTVTMDT